MPLNTAIGFIERPAGVISGREIDEIARNGRCARACGVKVLGPAHTAGCHVQCGQNAEPDGNVNRLTIHGEPAAGGLTLTVRRRGKIAGP